MKLERFHSKLRAFKMNQEIASISSEIWKETKGQMVLKSRLKRIQTITQLGIGKEISTTRYIKNSNLNLRKFLCFLSKVGRKFEKCISNGVSFSVVLWSYWRSIVVNYFPIENCMFYVSVLSSRMKFLYE